LFSAVVDRPRQGSNAVPTPPPTTGCHKDRIIEYIKAQETHHHARTFREEFVDLLSEAGVEFDEERMN